MHIDWLVVVGYSLCALGGILLVWYFARPKAMRPYDAPALQPMPLYLRDAAQGIADVVTDSHKSDLSIGRLSGLQMLRETGQLPALKIRLGERFERPNTSEYVKALETEAAIEVPAPVVKIKRPAGKRKKLKTKGK